MSEWKRTTIGDALTLQRGFDITRAEQRLGDIPVVSSGGIGSYHDTAAVHGPGVVIGRKGTLGKTFYLLGDYWPHDTTLWVKDFKGSYPRFVYYFFINFDVMGMDVGSANPTLNRNHIHPLPVLWPDRDVQVRIANLLGALDDKIAANDRIAGTVLNLADAFFEEAATGLALGPDSFGTIASVYGGGTPRTSQPSYWDGGIEWTTPTDVTALKAPYLFKTSRTITEEGLANCASQLYPAGSIFMTSRATIGAFAVPQMPAAVNQGFIVVVPPREELRWWLFHEMRSQVDEMLSLANGSTFLELSRKNFKTMPARIAPSDVLTRFDAKVALLHRRAAETAAESTALSELRDYLLPRLMSGQIRVRDAEKAIEDVT